MKTFKTHCLIFIVFLSTFIDSKQIKNTGTAFFVTDNGYALTRLHLIKNEKSIIGYVNKKKVEFELIKKDLTNDIALLKPLKSIQTTPIKLTMEKLNINDEVYAKTFLGKANSLMHSGKIIDLKGIENDIHHQKIQFNNNSKPEDGPVFSKNGICFGIVSSKVSDIYSLIQNRSDHFSIAFIQVFDTLYPLLKDIDGIQWVKKTHQSIPENQSQKNQNSVFYIHSQPEDKTANDDYKSIRDQIPEGVFFILVDVSSGYEQTNFANILLKEIKHHSIGQEVSQSIKKSFYEQLYKKFGHSQLDSEGLLRMAADLTRGYFLEAYCQVAADQTEDMVLLKLFEPQSQTALITINQKELLNESFEQTVIQLTKKAVLKLKAGIEDNNIRNLI